MRPLLDQDVYAATARFLRGLNHQVLRAHEAGYARATDAELLADAREREYLLVSRDRDFGNLVFLHGAGPGVLYLRSRPSTLRLVHQVGSSRPGLSRPEVTGPGGG